MNFDFLKNAKVKELSHNPNPSQASNSGVSVANMHEGASIRVYASGRVGFTPEFITEHKLQFTSKAGQAHRQGIDIVPSWYLKQMFIEQKVIFICFTSGNQSRIDMLGSTKYNDDGSPKGDANKGTLSTMLRNYLLEMEDVSIPFTPTNAKDLKDHNVKVTELFKQHFGSYVDIKVHTDMELFDEIKVWYLPKSVIKGNNKGDMTTVRRDNAKLFPIEIVYRNFKEETQVEEVKSQSIQEEPEQPQTEETQIDGEVEETDLNSLDDMDLVQEESNESSTEDKGDGLAFG